MSSCWQSNLNRIATFASSCVVSLHVGFLDIEVPWQRISIRWDWHQSYTRLNRRHCNRYWCVQVFWLLWPHFPGSAAHLIEIFRRPALLLRHPFHAATLDHTILGHDQCVAIATMGPHEHAFPHRVIGPFQIALQRLEPHSFTKSDGWSFPPSAARTLIWRSPVRSHSEAGDHEISMTTDPCKNRMPISHLNPQLFFQGTLHSLDLPFGFSNGNFTSAVCLRVSCL